jgi:hypothetical protein
MRSFAKQAEKQTYMPNAKMGHDLVTKQRPLSAFFVLKLTDYRF